MSRRRTSRTALAGPASLPPEEEALRPLYSRLLRLRQLDPGGLPCFAFFEGTLMVAALLALAEFVPWWGVPVMPVIVALLVKANDLVAVAVVRSAARTPQMERERFQRSLAPAVGRATVPQSVPQGRARPLVGGPVAVAGTTRPALPEPLIRLTARVRQSRPRSRAGGRHPQARRRRDRQGSQN